MKPVVGVEGGKVRVVVERDLGIELAKQESIVKVKVSPTDGSVVFAEGIAGSSVSTRIAGSLVSTGGASIGRASIAGASITGASIAGASIAGASIAGASIARASIGGASITGASRASIADSNVATKHSNSTSPSVDGGRYSSFSCFLSSFRWYCPSRLKSLAVK